MKKNFKLVLALVLAAMMIVGSIAAIADTDGQYMSDIHKDDTLTVSGLDSGDTVKFYQILQWDGSAHTAGSYGGWVLKTPFNDMSKYTGWTFTASTDADKQIEIIKKLIGDPKGNPTVAMNLDSQIAGILARIPGTSDGVAGTVSGTSATYTPTGDNKLGLYMALVTPADANTLYNPVFVSLDYSDSNNTDTWNIIKSSATYSDSAAAKKSTVTLTKTDEVDSSTSYDPTPRNARIGEKINYTVTTTVPNYGKIYTNPHFVIKDKLSDGLTLDTTSIMVKLGTDAAVASSSNFTVTPATNGYTITFDGTYLKGLTAPVDVVVTYKATITSIENMNVNTETNEAWVEYNHNPSNENDYDYKKDDTNHYTFTIDANVIGGYEGETRKSGSEIIKVAVDASGNPLYKTKTTSVVTTTNEVKSPLAGAKFELLDKDKNAYVGANNQQYNNLISDASGRINITGLDAGVYYLHETSAPNGFIKSNEYVKIEIIPVYENKTVTMYTNGTDWKYEKEDATYKDEVKYEMQILKSYTVKVRDGAETTYTFDNGNKKEIKVSDAGTVELPSSIPNTQGVELPSTGGIGTTIFYVGGSLMVLAAAILLITKRRMGAED